jgi:biotin synthase
MDRIHKAGGSTHLFCFFPEAGSRMEDVPQPPVGQYRRIQLARHLIDTGIASYQDFTFNPQGQILSFGIDPKRLEAEIRSGLPFMTSGCPDETGRTVCTRPYGDCKPGDDIRSYPFLPDEGDLIHIQRQLLEYGRREAP